MDGTPSTVNGPTILCIDGQRAMLELCTLAFANLAQDYQLFVSDDPGTAIQLAKTKCPDVIIIDPLGMLRGVDLCWDLQTHPPTNTIPFIYAAARWCIGEDVLLAGLDFVKYVFKPFRPVEIIEAVQSILETPAIKESTILAISAHQDAFRKVIASAVARLGHEYNVVFSDNPEAAVRLARAEHPVMILIDPIDSNWGVDVCRELQTHPLTKSIPRLLMARTFDIRSNVVLHGLEFAGMISIPFRDETFLAKLRDVLNTPAERLPKLEYVNQSGEIVSASSRQQARRSRKYS